MKSIKGWRDWYVHPFTLVYIIVSIVTGNFFEYISALLIVCIHESGHYLMAKLFKFKIEKVEIFPFGAFLSIRDFGLHHICQELIMLLAGLAWHLPIYFVIKFCGGNEYLLSVNRLVFVFNLLPIYPLDGSKILLLIISMFKDYYQAIKLQIKISLLALSLLIVWYNKASYLFVYFYLLYCNYEYVKEFRFMIIRLFLNRLVSNEYHRYKINEQLHFYRPYRNLYMIDGKTLSEKEMIKKLIKNLKTN